jgi:hypothetical protein
MWWARTKQEGDRGNTFMPLFDPRLPAFFLNSHRPIRPKQGDTASPLSGRYKILSLTL